MVFCCSLWDNYSRCQQESAGYSMTENHNAVQSLERFPKEKLNNLQREDGCLNCGKLKQAGRKMVWNCIVGIYSLSNFSQQEMFSLQ